MSFKRLRAAICKKGAPICAGLDPRPEMFRSGESVWEFSKRIIDAVADIVPCVKPQSAFYEVLGLNGYDALRRTIEYARAAGLYVILDAKRGDIGTSAEAYANAYLAVGAEFEVDAITVNPYIGTDCIIPFLNAAKKHDKALFALVKTSNPSAGEIQDVITDTGEPVYLRTAAMADSLNEPNHIGYVVGSTYPSQLTELRARYPETFFLIPGYGAQGGTAADVQKAYTASGGGVIVNNSRGIIAADDPREAAIKMKEDLRRH